MSDAGPKRRQIIAGMVLAMLYATAVLWGGSTFWQIAPDTALNRMAFAAPWLLLPGLSLLVAIGCIARARFFDDATIDGDAPAENSSMEINLRYLANTLEQCVLVVIGLVALAHLLPTDQLGAVPALAVSFVFARLCFWVGYHRSGPARAFGFAATFYPTVVIYLWSLILWLG